MKRILLLSSIIIIAAQMQAQIVYVPSVPSVKRYGLSPIEKPDERPHELLNYSLKELQSAKNDSTVIWQDLYNSMVVNSKLYLTGDSSKSISKTYCIQCYQKGFYLTHVHNNLKTIDSVYHASVFYFTKDSLPNGVDLDSIKRVRVYAKIALYQDWVEHVPVRFFPGRNSVFTEKFFGNSTQGAVEAFKNGYLNIDPGLGASYYNEFVAGYLGPFRLGVGGMFAKAKQLGIDTNAINSVAGSATPVQDLHDKVDSLNKINQYNNSIQQLLGGGGNLVVNIAMPLFDFGSCGNQFRMFSTVYNRTSLQLPVIGTENKSVAFVNENGIEACAAANFQQMGNLLKTPTAQQTNLSLFIQGKISWVTGDRNFIQNFGLNYDDKGGKQRYFGYAEVYGGIQLYMFRIFISKQFLFGQDFNKYSAIAGTYKPAVVTVGTQVVLSSFWN